MQNEVPLIEYLPMEIDAYPKSQFLVAKLERISSAPAQVLPIRDDRQVALERLVDIFRCGKNSRNYKDFAAIKKLGTTFGPLTTNQHWALYVERIIQAKSLDRLDLFQLRRPSLCEASIRPDLTVKYHIGRMDEKPYVVAEVGDVLASPAPIFLLPRSARDSALVRLYDVFCIGRAGSAYRELLQMRQSRGQTAEDVQAEWNACQSAVLWEIDHARRPSVAPQGVKSKWQACDEGIERELKSAAVLARDMGLALELERDDE
jgi:hypothetical protein